MGDHVLFFYGTLMAPQILHRVIHGRADPEPWQTATLTFKPAILHGYRRHRVRGADYPGIVPSSASSSSSPGSVPGSGSKNNANSDTSIENNGSPTTPTPTTTTPTPTASVLGTLVSGLTDGDVHRLDIFEGSEYTKHPVTVRTLQESLSIDGDSGRQEDGHHLQDVLDAAGAEFADEGEEVEAVTYVYVAGLERLEDAEWDFESFKRDKMAWWVGCDESEW